MWGLTDLINSSSEWPFSGDSMDNQIDLGSNKIIIPW